MIGVHNDPTMMCLALQKEIWMWIWTYILCCNCIFSSCALWVWAWLLNPAAISKTLKWCCQSSSTRITRSCCLNFNKVVYQKRIVKLLSFWNFRCCITHTNSTAARHLGTPFFQISVTHFKYLSKSGHLSKPEVKGAQLEANMVLPNCSFNTKLNHHQVGSRSWELRGRWARHRQPDWPLFQWTQFFLNFQ